MGVEYKKVKTLESFGLLELNELDSYQRLISSLGSVILSPMILNASSRAEKEKINMERGILTSAHMAEKLRRGEHLLQNDQK